MSLNELTTTPQDAISSVRFSPDGSRLLVSSWDKSVNIYTRGPSGSIPEFFTSIECNSPVLDACWGNDNATIFTVGLDQDVVQYNVEGGAESAEILSTHDKASNKIEYSKEHGILLSTSWDGTMHIHAPSTRRYFSMQLVAKPFALSLTADRVVVAMAERHVYVYDLGALKALVEQAGETANAQQPIAVEPWQQRESSLKFMARDISCMPDGSGFATSSIEGRVGVEWFDPAMQELSYAFKCHREKSVLPDEDQANGENVEVDVIYPVNAIAFHPLHGTFATGGGDGVIALWDAQTKRRVRQYPKLPASVAALDFSADGKLLATGISPGFEDGMEAEQLDPSLVKVIIRELSEAEAKGKQAKEK